MNESLLIGQLVLLVVLVPVVYTANFYYKAYHELREKFKKVNGALVLDKLFLMTELHELVEDMQDVNEEGDFGSADYAYTWCRNQLQAVLDGNKRRIDESRKRVS